MENFEQDPKCKTGYLSLQSFKNSLNYFSKYLSEKSREYLIVQIFSYSNDLNKLNYQKLFEIIFPRIESASRNEMQIKLND